MTTVRAIVLRAAGINCDVETEHALQLAGAQTERVHINRLIAAPAMLDDFQILVVPGGFSYGDDVAAGKILANQIVHHLSDILQRFIENGKLVLGICNGFQVLIKTGIVPGLSGAGRLTLEGEGVTLTNNDCGHYLDCWVHLAPATTRCVFIDPNRRLYLPIAHGEGKIVADSIERLQQIRTGGYVAFRYVDADGQTGLYPINPNGSQDSIAALTDSTGRVLGMMPHPERFVRWTQHPHWTRLKQQDELTDGMTIFTNAVNYIKQTF
ncbi:MAG TPA: phosphoribosylformylglycinamidine synthase I [Anaerohalosphaeraceae bacterium]|nr:phosphoribosylformylglycinamidine synthase I [Anaerohalosphaeraceae bacterium]HPC63209.1 phosphoribosylformylglycinamidine synthase I [Anaerohalosphaeraceae bacterium]HRS70343.1 phosphoribosylformylglycinamidine synthase I [Anaerohalosphaeraceae bacterium]HRV19074.1 phosphoribosylformylglycinamidine synthase I [Anaerohalosphaeraceae bacterium]